MLGAILIVLIGANTFTQQTHDEAIYAEVSKQLKGYIDIYIHINHTDHSDNHQDHDNNHHHSNLVSHQFPSRRICVGQYYSNSSSSSMSIPMVDVQYDDDDEVRVVHISRVLDKMSVFSDIISNFL
jgi:hypothetical protein